MFKKIISVLLAVAVSAILITVPVTANNSEEVKISNIDFKTKKMTVDGYENLSDEARGIVAVYNDDGTLEKAYISKNTANATNGTLEFENIEKTDKKVYGFLWKDHNGLTCIPVADKYTYIHVKTPAKITINYVDEEGNAIKDAITVEGEYYINDSYTVPEELTKDFVVDSEAVSKYQFNPSTSQTTVTLTEDTQINLVFNMVNQYDYYETFDNYIVNSSAWNKGKDASDPIIATDNGNYLHFASSGATCGAWTALEEIDCTGKNVKIEFDIKFAPTGTTGNSQFSIGNTSPSFSNNNITWGISGDTPGHIIGFEYTKGTSLSVNDNTVDVGFVGKWMHVEADANFAAKTISIKLSNEEGKTAEIKNTKFLSSCLNTIGSMYLRAPAPNGTVALDNLAFTVMGDAEGGEVSPLNAKTMYAFGDSIVYGHKTPASAFVNLLANKYNMYLTKYAKNGATVIDSSNDILAQVNNASSTAPDFVVFDGYTNDAYDTVNSVIGTVQGSSATTFDSTTFCGAFEEILYTMKKKWPTSKLVFMTIHKSGARDFDIQTNLHALTLDMCEKWDIEVVDVFADATLDTRNTDEMAKYIIDGAGSHPNVVCCEEFYVPMLTRKLLELCGGQPTTEPTTAPTRYTNYAWDFSAESQLGTNQDSNTPYITNGAEYNTANANIKLNQGGVVVDFDKTLKDETVTIEFDMYLGKNKGETTGYTIDSSEGNIVTIMMEEYNSSESKSYITIAGNQLATGSGVLAYANRVNGDGMSAQATHFTNQIDLKNGIGEIIINGASQGVFTGKFTADDISKLSIVSTHTGRPCYVDNIKITGSQSENLVQSLEDYAKELAIPDTIYGNLYMPSEYRDATIEWSSNITNVTSDGKVTRAAEDLPAKITAVITRNEEKLEKEFDCVVKAMPEKVEAPEAYLFVHFVGTDSSAEEEQVYFSVSKDGRNWETINSSKPVLTSDIGEKGVRDPHIIRSPEGDKFFLIATDLSIYNRRSDPDRWTTCQKSGSKSIIVWESTDLVDWSSARKVSIAPDNAGCAWAPESIYDRETGEYMVFWASKESDDGFSYQRIYRSYTRDFKHFTEPEIYIDNATREDIAAGVAVNNIDTTILEESGVYYRFTKNESKSSVIMEKGTRLDAFEEVQTYTINGHAGNEVTGYEGPTVYKMNGEEQWCLMLDAYAAKDGYKPFVTNDISKGEFASEENYSFDAEYRHGTVIPITKKEYDDLKREYAATVETKYLADQMMFSSGNKQLKASEAESGRQQSSISAEGSMLYAGMVDFDSLNSLTLRYGFGAASGNTAKLEVYAYGDEEDFPANPNLFDINKVLSEGTKIADVSSEKAIPHRKYQR